MRYLLIAPLALLAAACQPAQAPEAEGSATPVADSSPGQPVYQGITAADVVHFTGTEPFWSGEIGKGEARYSTPENADGTRFAVNFFAGNNGVSYAGTMDGAPWDMTVTPGTCSDGMSDRGYPFTVTLEVAGEQRQGCAWTDRQGFTGPANP